jgi:hypothetical protein
MVAVWILSGLAGYGAARALSRRLERRRKPADAMDTEALARFEDWAWSVGPAWRVKR